jgi:hypothetical protein
MVKGQFAVSKSLHVYHYTTQKGLKGIIENKSLQFTNMFFLNDASEFKYTIDLAKEVLKKKLDYAIGSLIGSHYNLKEQLNDIGSSIKHVDILKKKEIIDYLDYKLDFFHEYDEAAYFVFSFSEDPDLLSQWRGYCSNGAGCCIGFDSEKLDEWSTTLSRSRINFLQCEYNKNSQSDKISKSIDAAITTCIKEDIFELVKKWKTTPNSLPDSTEALTKAERKRLTMFGLKFLMKIIEYAPIFKHPTFFQENEWRLIKYVDDNIKEEILFRPTGSMLVPYIKVEIPLVGGKLPVTEIVIGPTNHPDLAKRAVKDLLKKNSIPDVKVSNSKIPYRGQFGGLQ